VRLPTFLSKIRQFAVRSRHCVITLVLLSTSLLCALAQKPGPVQQGKASALVSTAWKSTESFEDVSVAQGAGHALRSGYKPPSEGRMDDSAHQGFAHAVGWSSWLRSGWTSSGDLSIGLSDRRSSPGAYNKTE
jgi:hypothetical protein